MDNPFTPVWNEHRKVFEPKNQPSQWLEGRSFTVAPADSGDGAVFTLDNASLFVGHGTIGWDTEDGHEFIEFNRELGYTVDDHGDFVACDMVPVCMVVNDAQRWSIIYPDGSVLVDHVTGVMVRRTLFTHTTVRSWEPRLHGGGFEVSDTAITFEMSPLAQRTDKNHAWSWCIPDHRVEPVCDLIESALGVRP